MTFYNWVQTAIMIIGFLGLVGVSLFFIFSRIRKEDLETLRTANKDLRDSIEDKAQKIAELQERVAALTSRVTEVESRNNNLTELVKEALIAYFRENPDAAQRVSVKVV